MIARTCGAGDSLASLRRQSLEIDFVGTLCGPGTEHYRLIDRLHDWVHSRRPVGPDARSYAFVGVAVALSPQMAGELDLIGVASGVCGALTFAIYSVGRSLAKVETEVVGPSLGLAGIGALAEHVVLEPDNWFSTTQWIAVIVMGIGPFTLANVCWDKAPREGSAATISSLAYLTPMVAMGLLAILGLGVVTISTILGALFAMTGAVLSSASNTTR